MAYELYVLDTETTGLDPQDHSPVEVSIFRLSTKKQKTWCLKPINTETISLDALRVNGINIDDLLWRTKEGREKYREVSTVLVEIENWLMDDFVSAADRIIVGHNSPFDKMMLECLWKKSGSYDTFPFNKKYVLDTFQLEFFMDYCNDNFATGYNLASLAKKYGIINAKAHTAAADTLATVSVFNKQVETFKKLLNK